MLKSALLAGAVALALSSPVAACETIESVQRLAAAYGGIADVIEGDLLEEFAASVGATVPKGAERALFVAGASGNAYGFEMPDGCLTGPVFIQPDIKS